MLNLGSLVILSDYTYPEHFPCNQNIRKIGHTMADASNEESPRSRSIMSKHWNDLKNILLFEFAFSLASSDQKKEENARSDCG